MPDVPPAKMTQTALRDWIKNREADTAAKQKAAEDAIAVLDQKVAAQGQTVASSSQQIGQLSTAISGGMQVIRGDYATDAAGLITINFNPALPNIPVVKLTPYLAADGLQVTACLEGLPTKNQVKIRASKTTKEVTLPSIALNLLGLKITIGSPPAAGHKVAVEIEYAPAAP